MINAQTILLAIALKPSNIALKLPANSWFFPIQFVVICIVSAEKTDVSKSESAELRDIPKFPQIVRVVLAFCQVRVCCTARINFQIQVDELQFAKFIRFELSKKSLNCLQVCLLIVFSSLKNSVHLN